jgi:hypothetical protein
MGLLEELEQEAERQRAEQARLAGERAVREHHWNERLLPAMRALDEYLQRLARNLAFVKRRTRVVYPLPGYGDVIAHLEPNFILQSTPTASSYEITMEGVANVATDDCPQVVCDSVARVRSVSAVLQQHRLGGVTETSRSPNGEATSARCQARGRIPLHLQVTADLESGQARMTFQNFEGFGQSSRSFTAEQLDSALFDALGRYLMREESTFAQESLDVELRRQLQSRIQRDQAKRAWEHKLGAQLADDEREVRASLQPAARPGLFGRLSRLLRR